jgi:hypothetical protein
MRQRRVDDRGGELVGGEPKAAAQRVRAIDDQSRYWFDKAFEDDGRQFGQDQPCHGPHDALGIALHGPAEDVRGVGVRHGVSIPSLR